MADASGEAAVEAKARTRLEQAVGGRKSDGSRIDGSSLAASFAGERRHARTTRSVAGPEYLTDVWPVVYHRV